MSNSCVIAFIIALKAKAVANNWDRVCRLFEATLQSAYNQTEGDFRIIAVCHDRPALRHIYDDRVEFITVDFPPPPQVHDLMMKDKRIQVHDLMMEDKWRKLAWGVKRAGELAPGFVMLMDADDLVNNRLVAHAKKYPDSNGWVIRRGYFYNFGSLWIKRTNSFDCGTNALVSSRLIRFPENLGEESVGNCVILRWGHTRTAEKLAEAGTPLEPLPFRGAIFISGHGENASDLGPWGDKPSWSPGWLVGSLIHQICRIRTYQFLGPKVIKEFSLKEILATAD